MKLAGIFFPDAIPDAIQEYGALGYLIRIVCLYAQMEQVPARGTLTTMGAQDMFTKAWALRWELELEE